MLGGHSLAVSATNQNVVATNSGEAEFYALTKSASRALGAVAMAPDLAKGGETTCRVDATASKAIASRRGVARVRHLHAQVLGCKRRWHAVNLPSGKCRESKIPPTWGRNTWLRVKCANA